MKRPPFVVFDLDGTLVDTMPAHAEAFATVCEQAWPGSAEACRGRYLATAGEVLRGQFAQAAPGPLSDGAIDVLVDGFWRALGDHPIVCFPEVPRVLAALADLEVPLFVSSGSSQAQVERKLREAGLSALFAGAWGEEPEQEDGTKGAGHLRRARRLLGLDPVGAGARPWFTGDGQQDMRLASAAGALGIGRVGLFSADALRAAGAWRTVADLQPLPQWIAGWS